MPTAKLISIGSNQPAISEEERAKELHSHNQYLEEQRSSWEVEAKEIVQYVLPDHGFFSGQDKPDEQAAGDRSSIIDDTAEGACEVAAAGMQGGLTSPARPWFKLGLVDEDLEKLQPVKEWLGSVEKSMYRVFARSNFYDSMHTMYLELIGFGTAPYFVLEDWKDIIRVHTLTAGEYCIAANDTGRVDTIFRRFWLPLRAVVLRFGEENLSQSLQSSVEKTPYEYYEILHVVKPREDRDRNRIDSRNMPWESIYVEFENPKGFLLESGFQEFPCMSPRWKVIGSNAYGRSPGMRVLPSVKMLQELQKSQIVALHKRNDPPMRIPSYYKGRLRTYPGGQNWYAGGQDPGGLEPLYTVQPEVDKTEAKIERVQWQIKEGLYEDLFKMISNPMYGQPPTATEIAERHEEKLIMLGPVIERQTHESLDPCIDRTFGIMLRRNMIPPPPEAIQGMDLTVKYISLLAQAQKLVATRSIRATTGFVAELAEAKQDPSVWDMLDTDKAIANFHDAAGAPAELLRAEDEIKEIRAMRQQRLAREQQRREIGENIEAMKLLSETPTGATDTALTELKEGLEGSRGGAA